ncbi:MAG: 4'-phosphopantetheinyl transferase family protein, partial [Candidatus Binatia bacterium]
MNASPHLRPYAVDVLTADLDVEASHTEELVATLSTDERERATCFRFPLDRTRFIARRALLRRFLAERLALPAAKLRYSCDTYG